MGVQPRATSSSRPSARSLPAIGCQPRNAEQGPRTGVWIIGARGAVATTTIVGARAAARGLFPLRGVTTEGPRGEGLSLPAASALVFGGWEVRAGSLLDAAADLAESGRIFDGRLLDPLAVDLDEIDQDIVRGGTRGVPHPCGAVETPAEVIEQLAADLRGFRRRHSLERVVVVNLATTEPIFATPEDHLTLAALEERLPGRSAAVFRPSTLYAYAAIREGAAFINFAASPAAL